MRNKMKKIIYTKEAPEPVGPYSQAVEVNGMIYCSGQIPLSPQTGEIVGTHVTEQTEQVCKNIEQVLKQAGTGFDNVIKTMCFLSDMDDFSAFNEVYARYFVSRPARSCVAVKTLPKNVLVEVEVIAAK